MSDKVAVTKNKLDLLANAVSSATGASIPLTIDQMRDEVGSIVHKDEEDILISNGQVSIPAGNYTEDVAVPLLTAPVDVQSYYFDDTLTIEGYNSTHNTNYIGFSPITIKGDANLIASNIKNGVVIFGVIGSYTGSGGSSNLQTKTNISPTESSQTITPDSGYDGLSSVQINAISNTYVGSGITRRSSSNLTASGATVTVPAGYYSAQATKSVTTMTLPTSAASSATSGYTSKATIGRSTSAQYINIPAGYNSAGGYYTISATPNGSATTPTTTITANPTISINSSGLITASVSGSQNITPTVSAGYVSSGTAGTVSVSGSKTQQLTTKAAATITPSTSNQTIASGTYLTGTQTIAGDANLIGSNIISGKSIFGVAGTVAFQTYYTGSSTPASSLGSNGDIYLMA